MAKREVSRDELGSKFTAATNALLDAVEPQEDGYTPVDLRGMIEASLQLQAMTLLLLCEDLGIDRLFVIRVIEGMGKQLIPEDDEEPDAKTAFSLVAFSHVLSELKAQDGPHLRLIRGGRSPEHPEE